MNSLSQIKDTYAKEYGYEDWDEMSNDWAIWHHMEYHMGNILILAQKQALKNASESADIHYPLENNYNACVDKQSILNENNIVK